MKLARFSLVGMKKKSETEVMWCKSRRQQLRDADARLYRKLVADDNLPPQSCLSCLIRQARESSASQSIPSKWKKWTILCSIIAIWLVGPLTSCLTWPEMTRQGYEPNWPAAWTTSGCCAAESDGRGFGSTECAKPASGAQSLRLRGKLGSR